MIVSLAHNLLKGHILLHWCIISYHKPQQQVRHKAVPHTVTPVTVCIQVPRINVTIVATRRQGSVRLP